MELQQRWEHRDDGVDYSELFDTHWWPLGRETIVRYGTVGHDMEFTVNIDGYDGFENKIPDLVFEAIRANLGGMKAENRGSRIEVHPAGRLFTRVSAERLDEAEPQLLKALEAIGLKIVEVSRHHSS
jgi:hypothetical protein